MGGGHTGASERASARATERARLKDRTVSIFQARALDPVQSSLQALGNIIVWSANYALARSLASVATQSLARSLARTLVSLAEPLHCCGRPGDPPYFVYLCHEQASPAIWPPPQSHKTRRGVTTPPILLLGHLLMSTKGFTTLSLIRLWLAPDWKDLSARPRIRLSRDGRPDMVRRTCFGMRGGDPRISMDKAVNKEIVDLRISPKMVTANANMVVVSPT
uniref:(California timema) hypothetical protein n=1 Tax=Timema californicum TaxID=61474 RepID=A0A7R9IZW2_TIMCA|nr:unnamed protein product [Timema californicum]